MRGLMPKVYQVKGPPGCGKTTYLSEQAKRAAEATSGEQVVICSLTKAAAAQITAKELPIPEDNIGTLHALSYRALNQPNIAETRMKYWNEAHPDLELKGHQKTQIDTDFPTQQLDSQKGHADEMYARMNLLRASRFPKKVWPGNVKAFADTWQRWCSENNYIDFTGLIERTLRDIPCAPGGPTVLLADEAQDYSRLEFDLLNKWGKQTDSLIICADPDQAIYEWRGADPNIFINNPVPEENKRTLSQSYRVPKAVHAFATNWIYQIERREHAPYNPTDERGDVTRASFTYKDFEAIIRAYEKSEGSFMMLASCEYMLTPIITALRQEGIPFHNPYRKNHGSWNPIQRRTKQTTVTDRILNFARTGLDKGTPMLKVWTVFDVYKIIEHLDSKRVLKQGAKTKMKRLCEGVRERRKTNKSEPDILMNIPGGLQFFIDLFQTLDDADQCLLRNTVWWRNNILKSKLSVYEYPMRVFEERGYKALDEVPRLMLGTIHSVKGGEADTVMLFPDLSPVASQRWVSTTERDALIRVFYVGATRARHRLILAKGCTPHAVGWN